MNKKELLDIQEAAARKRREFDLRQLGFLTKYDEALTISDVYTLLRGKDSEGITKVMLKIKKFEANNTKEEA